jgi:hypothetical protein
MLSDDDKEAQDVVARKEEEEEGEDDIAISLTPSSHQDALIQVNVSHQHFIFND